MENLNQTLDPEDWSLMRNLGHTVIDDVMDYLENISSDPVWKAIPSDVKQSFLKPLPQEPTDIRQVYEEFKTNILPFATGNNHPRFFAWVQGTGTPLGVLAEMLAASMNSNVAIGEHAAIYVDEQVVNWCKQMMNYPDNATGILLSGASMANITALTVARNSQLKENIRGEGLGAIAGQMVLYCSKETHSCIQKAAEVLGLGTQAVRRINVNEAFQMDIPELIAAIESDLENGFYPFCVVGTAGTVNTGAIDPLDGLVAICKKYNLWLHIDGAYGALAKMVPSHSAQLKAIEKADSIAFDLHKWLYMPYEIGCVLIKDRKAHRESFAIAPNYLLNEQGGLAAGPDPISNYGIELSRGFKALKVWMSLKEHGIIKYTDIINKNILQALYLKELIKDESNLQLLTPVALNIVCFRYLNPEFHLENTDNLNREILIKLQEQGVASPSATIINNTYAIRVCLVNQRTKQSDLDLLIRETLRIGNDIVNKSSH